MYVDESGDSGLTGSPTSYFALSGIVVHETKWRDFINRLIAFKKTLREVYSLPVRAEIHASEFVNSRVFQLKRHDRLAILRNAIDELAKIEHISITNLIVDKTNKAADFDVFDVAWRVLFQRFENTLKYGNFPGQHRTDYGLVITDATAGHKLTKIVRKMSVFNHIPNNQAFGPGSRNIPILKIIEDPFGKDSAQTLPVQMADVTAYFLHQRFKPNSFIQRQRAYKYFDRLQPVLNVHASRTDSLGIVRI
jgi:hypothetical protein